MNTSLKCFYLPVNKEKYGVSDLYLETTIEAICKILGKKWLYVCASKGVKHYILLRYSYCLV